MSIASAIAAEESEKKRLEWLSALRTAYDAKDWDGIAALIAAMDKFYFRVNQRFF